MLGKMKVNSEFDLLIDRIFSLIHSFLNAVLLPLRVWPGETETGEV